MKGSAETNDGSHYPPKKATKSHYVRSVIFITKHATDGGGSCLYAKSWLCVQLAEKLAQASR